MVFKKIKEWIKGLILDIQIMYLARKLKDRETDMIDYRPEKEEENGVM